MVKKNYLKEYSKFKKRYGKFFTNLRTKTKEFLIFEFGYKNFIKEYEKRKNFYDKFFILVDELDRDVREIEFSRNLGANFQYLHEKRKKLLIDFGFKKFKESFSLNKEGILKFLEIYDEGVNNTEKDIFLKKEFGKHYSSLNENKKEFFRNLDIKKIKKELKNNRLIKLVNLYYLLTNKNEFENDRTLKEYEFGSFFKNRFVSLSRENKEFLISLNLSVDDINKELKSNKLLEGSLSNYIKFFGKSENEINELKKIERTVSILFKEFGKSFTGLNQENKDFLINYIGGKKSKLNDILNFKLKIDKNNFSNGTLLSSFSFIKRGLIKMKNGYFVCDECGFKNTFCGLLIQRIQKNYRICKNCFKRGYSNSSSKEIELGDFLKKLNGIGKIYKKFIKTNNFNYEIDIFLEKYSIGIEYDGMYFHNNDKRMLEKTRNFKKEFNGNLLHVYEDSYQIFKEGEINRIESIILTKSGKGRNKRGKFLEINEINEELNFLLIKKKGIKNFLYKTGKSKLFFSLNELNGKISNIHFIYGKLNFSSFINLLKNKKEEFGFNSIELDELLGLTYFMKNRNIISSLGYKRYFKKNESDFIEDKLKNQYGFYLTNKLTYKI